MMANEVSILSSQDIATQGPSRIAGLNAATLHKQAIQEVVEF
jgi:hypothetical protein